MIKQKQIIFLLFIGYCGWNLYFLLQGEIPSSIFKTMTGLPCPTTGGTRAVKAFFSGELGEAFLYNPLTLIYILLAVLSFGYLFYYRIQQKILSLPWWLCRGWLLALGVGWVVKFLLPTKYW